jgi:pimeloyl-ACP methyl ester carboxylesterase
LGIAASIRRITMWLTRRARFAGLATSSSDEVFADLYLGHDGETVTGVEGNVADVARLQVGPDALPVATVEYLVEHSGSDGWRGAIGLYQSVLQEGDEIADLVADHKLSIPVLAIGAGGGEFTCAAMRQVSSDPVRSVTLEGVGHYAALEAPDQVAQALLDFFSTVDTT